MKIRVLDKQIAELIAAGEVIERPASIVKELVENSLDAKAKSINIEIQNGGKTLIRVQDNGCGIEREDVKLAFLRHATSKVKSQQDLDSIATFGFRGEALASICAVSKVTVKTKTKDESIGTEYKINGSGESSINDVGCPYGTDIYIKDLFYNVPARLKFLKKDVSESNAVASIIDKLAMCNPNVSFTFVREGKTVLTTPGNGDIKSCIFAIYGKEFLDSLIPVEYRSDDVYVKGFICTPSKARPNRNMQSFFINSRYVKSRTAMAALEQAYRSYIMVGKFPSCVLYIDLSFKSVDVNIHPAKIEVRFIDEKPIFNTVYCAVKNALIKDRSKISIELNQIKHTKEINDYSEVLNNKESIIRKEEKEIINRNEPPKQQKFKFKFTDDEEPEISIPTKSNFSTKQTLKNKNTPDLDKSNDDYQEKQNITQVSELSEHKTNLFEEDSNFKIIGELFKNYIILERRNNVFIIDKHAAHERLIYEKIKKQNLKKFSQYLLVPLKVTLEKQEYDSLLLNRNKLSKMGFDSDDFGDGTILIRSAPMMIEQSKIADTIIEISEYISKVDFDFEPSQMEQIYHSVACRSAIKAGDKTSEGELISLVLQLEKDKTVKFCPHGRPIYIVLTKEELEKSFKRR